ncbi:MAG TPA: DUF3099 domain-containing protein [Mycobacteriales bacterium]|nr:DUF3099 domain-containing protein [Mycobacteriales bacterium]
MRSRRKAVVDVVTPTPREARLADLARRRRRYLLVIVPCLALVAFGFFVPAPVPVRVVVLVVAAVLAPVAAIVANAGASSRR